MVDSDVMIIFGHVVDFDMDIRAGDKLASVAHLKKDPTEVTLLTRQHGHAASAGEDNIAIGYLIGLSHIGKFFVEGRIGWMVFALIGSDYGIAEAIMVVVVWSVVCIVWWSELKLLHKSLYYVFISSALSQHSCRGV